MTIMEDDLQNFSQAESAVRAEIYNLLQIALGKNYSQNLVEISYPPDPKLGDYTASCFLLAKKMKLSPAEVSKKIAQQVKPSELIKEVKAAGPYINFWINRTKFSALVLTEIAKEKHNYGSSKIGKGQKVMVEYFSPNTNKPLTIGHIRNICLGYSISSLLKFTGHKVIQSTLYNDRGIAIAKTILGYQKWGNAKKPGKLKPDHFVGSFYVKFSQEEKKDKNLGKEAQRVLQAWEADDPKTRKIWQQLMIWVLGGFKETLENLGIEKFDEEYYESEYYTEGKKIAEEGLKRGIFKKHSEGYVYAPLEKYSLSDKILLRSDGTSLYITQDMYLAALKNKHKIDKSIYVVGSEQDLQFKQLFKIIELLEFDNLKNLYHLSYGMIRLPGGKIKSREGLAEGTAADDLINQLENLAREEIKSRFSELTQKEIDKRASSIALSALKFYILQVNPKTTMVFDSKQSISFIGKTGPYLQYTHARINSLLEKAQSKPTSKVDFTSLNTQEEFNLIKQLSIFPDAVGQSVEKYDPSHLANYLYDLAKQFSLFYESSPILKAEAKTKKARLLLVNDTRIVLSTGLELLGIDPIVKM